MDRGQLRPTSWVVFVREYGKFRVAGGPILHFRSRSSAVYYAESRYGCKWGITLKFGMVPWLERRWFVMGANWVR